jgi:acetyl esterase
LRFSDAGEGDAGITGSLNFFNVSAPATLAAPCLAFDGGVSDGAVAQVSCTFRLAAIGPFSYRYRNNNRLWEASLSKGTRRQVLKRLAAAGALGLPAVRTLPMDAQAAGTPAYDPAARFDLSISEVEFRRNSAGRMLMARIYRPQGQGPFPTVLDLHGGAWNRKDRFAEEPMDRALAASGVLVVAIDMTLAPEAPYPACVQDANYAVRWLKANASTWSGDTAKIGVYGSSTGGHVAELLAMRPHDPRYNSIPLASGAPVDATVAYAAMRSPISNTFARYENAERRHNEEMVKYNKIFFNPWETIHESNPQEILEREEKVTLVPLLIMQGALDDNVLPDVQEKFARSYKAAGGNCDYHLFENSVHEWVAKPGAQTDAAREMLKRFVARHSSA